MNTKFSPGPWEVDNLSSTGTIYIFAPKPFETVAKIVQNKPVTDERRDANAKLIAAAPELLDTVAEMHTALLTLETFLRANDVALPTDVLEVCESACAKAQALKLKLGAI